MIGDLVESFDAGSIAHASVRLGIAAIVWNQWFREDLRFPEQPHPVGIARLVDVTPLADSRIGRVIDLAVRIALVGFVLGIGLPVVTVVLALFTAAVGALWGSQGGAGHAFQAVALVCLAQAAAHVAGVAMPADATADGGRALAWSRQALVAIYLTSGLTKLHRTHGAWIWRAPALGLHVAKTSEQDYQRTLDAETRERGRARADWLLRHPGLSRAGAAGALAVELSSPLLLLGPVAGFVGGIVLIAFHRANDSLLGHPFGQYQTLLLVLFANPLFLI